MDKSYLLNTPIILILLDENKYDFIFSWSKRIVSELIQKYYLNVTKIITFRSFKTRCLFKSWRNNCYARGKVEKYVWLNISRRYVICFHKIRCKLSYAEIMQRWIPQRWQSETYYSKVSSLTILRKIIFKIELWRLKDFMWCFHEGE